MTGVWLHLSGVIAVFDLGPMTDKFSESGQKVIYRAIEESKGRDHNFLSVEHIFTALSEVESSLYHESLNAIGVDTKAVRHLLEQELSKSRQYVGKKMYIADTTRELFNRALKRARQNSRQQIESYDLFVSLFSDPNGIPAEILRRLGVDPMLATGHSASAAVSLNRSTTVSFVQPTGTPGLFGTPCVSALLPAETSNESTCPW